MKSKSPKTHALLGDTFLRSVAALLGIVTSPPVALPLLRLAK